MKRIFLSMVLLAAAASVGYGQSAPVDRAANTTSKPGPLEQVLMRMQREEDEAEMQGDTAKLDRIYANNFVKVYPDGKKLNKTEFIARFKGMNAPPTASVAYDDVQVSDFGDTAVVTYRATFREPDPAGKGTATGSFRLMVVWVKQKGEWRVAATTAAPSQ